MLSILEVIAVATALLYIFYAAKEQVVCFVFGLISSAIYVYISFHAKYYYDSFINVYYVVMSVYGWFRWSATEQGPPVNIKKLSAGKWLMVLISGVLITILFGYIGEQNTDASLPYIDGFTTVFALVATWLVVEKYIENWLIWVVVDAVGIGMYWWKELYFTAGLFLIYTVIAVLGYIEWKKKITRIA